RHGAASPPASEQRGHTAPTLRSAQGDGYGSGSMSGSGSGSRRRWGVAAFALSVVVALAVLDHARARKENARDPTALPTTDVTTLPDDQVLLAELEKALDLRLREDFDRMLDAHEPGELVEHATITEPAFERSHIEPDALFVVGDELFGYPFRPENGWGSGGADRTAIGYTPELHRIQGGATGGPDGFACFSCHSKGGPDGAGTQTQNAFFRGDGERIVGADQRNAPQVLGVGPIACLAREMSAALQAAAAEAQAQAKAQG